MPLKGVFRVKRCSQVRREVVGRRNVRPIRMPACGAIPRQSCRHLPEVDQAAQALSAAIIDIAYARHRFGYRRIHDLLRPAFPQVNHKRVYRRTTNLASGNTRKPNDLPTSGYHDRSPKIAVDFGVSGQYVTQLLDQSAVFCGHPAVMRIDNGPEVASRAFLYRLGTNAWDLPHPD